MAGCCKSFLKDVAVKFWNTLSGFESRPDALKIEDILAEPTVTAPRELRSWASKQFTVAISHCVIRVKMLQRLLQNVVNCFPLPSQDFHSTSSLLGAILDLVHMVFFEKLPPYFHTIVFLFFDQSFRYLSHELKAPRQRETEPQNSEDEDVDASEEDDNDELLIDKASFAQICCDLSFLDWLGVCQGPWTQMMFARIRTRIRQQCAGSFDQPELENLVAWVEKVVYPWLERLFCDGQADTFPNHARKTAREENLAGILQHREPATASLQLKSLRELKQWRSRLLFFTYEEFARLRISEMFDIIVEFPDSLRALQNLKLCLEHTSQHQELITSLKAAFQKRLLQPGANTSDIIAQYIALIRAVGVLDPTGVVLSEVSQSTRAYLRSRPDTVRCVVTSLTGDGKEEKTDLMRELERSEQPQDADADSDMEGEQADEKSLAWQPKPVEALRLRTRDVISSLVDIFGTRDHFITEFRSLLAERLLLKAKNDFDCNQDLAHLERLKLRFGETSWKDCEVMVRDMEVSARLDSNIHNFLAPAQTPKPPSAPGRVPLSAPRVAASTPAPARLGGGAAAATPGRINTLPRSIAPAALVLDDYDDQDGMMVHTGGLNFDTPTSQQSTARRVATRPRPLTPGEKAPELLTLTPGETAPAADSSWLQDSFAGFVETAASAAQVADYSL